MWDRWARYVAIRQLRFGIAQSLLTIGVVSISVTLIIFIGSLIGGLQKRLIAIITGSIPNIVISQPQRLPIAAWEVPALRREGRVYIGTRSKLQQRKLKIEDWQMWIYRLQKFDPNVIAVSPVVEGDAILSSGESRKGVAVIGVIPERYNQVVEIQGKLRAGHFFGLKSDELALGYLIAQDMNLKLGDKVRLSTSEGASRTLNVAGIFETGYQLVDNSTAYVPLRTGQSLFGLGNAVTSIGIKLALIFEADNVTRLLRRQVPYEVKSWMEENQQLLTALRTQTQTSRLIMAFIVLASGFGIASILITSVTSKLQEIGILRAIGATRKQIIGLFTLQSTLMAAMGAVFGVFLGVGLSIATYRLRLATSAPGREEEVFPILLTPQLILGAMAIAIAVGFVASLYPAWRASKVSPIEVIRGA